METQFKLVSSNNRDLFEERLRQFVASLGEGDVIVDVKFSTAPLGDAVEFSALLHYQKTEAWSD